MPSPTIPDREQSLDLSFSVSFDYRLRFTRDVLREEPGVLSALMVGPERVRVLFAVDDAVDRALPWLASRLEAFPAPSGGRIEAAGPVHLVRGGERCKNTMHEVDALLDRVHDAGLDRQSYIIAIGGGAVLDAVGFAAATAHRGVRLIRLPTTTLAQADSGLGVKNAINRYGQKNWQGAFAVPWAVINDRALLQALPVRPFRAGFSEAVKVALLKDAAFFEWLCEHAHAIHERDDPATAHAIQRSALLHLNHITRGGDPFERRQARPLDFGHWSAHHLEALTEFQLPHGEAVAIGVALDCAYSALTQGLPGADAERAFTCLRDLGLTLWHPLLDVTDALLHGLEAFRQHLGGRLTLTLLRGIADPIESHRINPAALADAIDWLRERHSPHLDEDTHPMNSSKR